MEKAARRRPLPNDRSNEDLESQSHAELELAPEPPHEGVVAVDIAEDRDRVVVQEVEYVRAKLQVHAVRKIHLLDEADVEVPPAGVALVVPLVRRIPGSRLSVGAA